MPRSLPCFSLVLALAQFATGAEFVVNQKHAAASDENPGTPEEAPLTKSTAASLIDPSRHRTRFSWQRCVDVANTVRCFGCAEFSK